jgi:hypothetical protein
MSNTPLSDAIQAQINASDGSHAADVIAAMEFARQLEAKLEIAQMQLAACMTATLQNTETTIKDRIGRDNPYWCQAYADVCTSVDREMRERTRAEDAEALIVQLKEALDASMNALRWYRGEYPEADSPADDEHDQRVTLLLASGSKPLPKVIVLGTGAYCVAASSRLADGCPSITIRKLEKPEVPGSFLPPQSDPLSAFEVIIDVRSRAAAEVLLTAAQATLARFPEDGGPVLPAVSVRDLFKDKERLDWLDGKNRSNLGWVARESTTGRGYRVHQATDAPHPSARAAIDAARAIHAPLAPDFEIACEGCGSPTKQSGGPFCADCQLRQHQEAQTE